MLISSIALMVMSIMQFVPGMIHVFAPDGGAKSIAGFTSQFTLKIMNQLNTKSYGLSEFSEPTRFSSPS